MALQATRSLLRPQLMTHVLMIGLGGLAVALPGALLLAVAVPDAPWGGPAPDYVGLVKSAFLLYGGAVAGLAGAWFIFAFRSAPMTVRGVFWSSFAGSTAVVMVGIFSATVSLRESALAVFFGLLGGLFIATGSALLRFRFSGT